MPRYRFAMEDGERRIDPDGEMLANDRAALEHAKKIAKDLRRGRADHAIWRVIALRDDDTEAARVNLADVEL